MRTLIIALFLVSCGRLPEPAPVVPVPPTPPVPPKVSKVRIGTPAIEGMEYLWDNADSLDNAMTAQPLASPKKTTTYTVTVSSKCGASKAMAEVKVFRREASGELVEVK